MHNHIGYKSGFRRDSQSGKAAQRAVEKRIWRQLPRYRQCVEISLI